MASKKLRIALETRASELAPAPKQGSSSQLGGPGFCRCGGG